MADDRSSPKHASGAAWSRAPLVLDVATILLLPALTIYLGLNAGGYFAGDTGWAAVALAVALAIRMAASGLRLVRLRSQLVLAAAGLAAFALWTLLSGAWSGDWGAALIEFDRVLMYVLVMLVFGSIERPREAVRYLPHAFAVAAVFLCAVGLASRTVPDLFPFTPPAAAGKLAYPVTYSNGLGILAALAIILCLHLASWDRERAPTRILAAVALPLLAATLVLTRSEGAVVAGAVGTVIYVALARPRGLLTALLATAPFVVLAAGAASEAALLRPGDPTTTAAVDQGRELARTVGLTMLGGAAALALLVPLARRLTPNGLSGGPARLAALAAAVLAVGIASVAITRLPDAAGTEGNGEGWQAGVAWEARVDYWQVALDAFQADPVNGSGAATFGERWARDRPEGLGLPGSTEAHSLYLETLGELGLVGAGLIALVLGLLLASFVVGWRGDQRCPHAAALAASAAWLLHAGIDWDWELPVLTVWLFAFGGCALAAWPQGPAPQRAPSPRGRALVAAACLLLCVTPATIAISQSRLDGAVSALLRGDCPEAERLAASASSLVSLRAEPYEVLAYCASRRGEHDRAITMMSRAIDRDPDSWEYAYGLALVRAAGGEDPEAPALQALRLNPLEVMVREAVRGFAGVDLVEEAVGDFGDADPKRWRRQARASSVPLP